MLNKHFCNVISFKDEIGPHNMLYQLLLAFKSVCERSQQNKDAKENTIIELTKSNNEVWTIEDRKITRQVNCININRKNPYKLG